MSESNMEFVGDLHITENNFDEENKQEEEDLCCQDQSHIAHLLSNPTSAQFQDPDLLQQT